MAKSAEQKKAQRAKFMELLYRNTDGSRLQQMSADEMRQELGWTVDDTDAVVDYLLSERLISATMGNHVGITHEGVVEVEQAMSRPDRPTEHFSSMSIVNVSGNMIGSQIQSGTSNSTQHQEISIDSQRELLEEFLAEFRKALEDKDFPKAARDEARVNLDTVEGQLSLQRPNKAIVHEGLKSLRSITENLAASGLFIPLVALCHAIWS